MIAFHELEGFLDGKRGEMLAVIAAFKDDELEHRIDEASWTVAEIVEHLILVESYVVHKVAKMLESHETKESEPLDEKVVDALHLFQSKGLLGVKRKAPSAVEPNGQIPLKDGLSKLQEVRMQLKSYLPQLESRETNSIVAYFSMLGVDMNVCQWVQFASVHEWGHINQLKKMLEGRRTT